MRSIERLVRIRDEILDELEALSAAEARLRGVAEELEEIAAMREQLQVTLGNINVLLARHKREDRSARNGAVRPAKTRRPRRKQRRRKPKRREDDERKVYASVTVDGTDHDIQWSLTPHWPGIKIGKRIGGLAPIMFEDHGSVIFGLMNCFANAGPWSYSDLAVDYEDDGEVQEDLIPAKGKEGTIQPGYARFWMLDWGASPEPGTATEDGFENAWNHALSPSDLNYELGFPIYFGKDANGPGGQGIYQESDWAVGCTEGLASSLLILLGWANRNAIFRLDEIQWDQGIIAPHDFVNPDLPPYQGNDQTKTFAPQGYEGDVTIEGYRQLDHAHAMRMLNPAFITGSYGYSFGRFCTAMLAFDVEATWILPNANDTKANAHWWSVKGMTLNTPEGIGSHFAGRPINYAMQALAKAYMLDIDYELEESLLRMNEFLLHIYDESNHLFYRISYFAENGQPSNKWKHKVEQEGWDHSIPEGGKPDVYKGFEQALVWLGFRHFRRVVDDLDPDNAERRDEMELMVKERLMKQNRDLEVIGHPEWSSSREAPWNEFILDTISTSDLEFAKKSVQAWHSDNPLNAYTGDLS